MSKFHSKKVAAYLAEMEQLLQQGKKRCSSCGEIFDIVLFSKNKLKPGGYSHICGICLMIGWHRRHNKEIPSREEIEENIRRIALRQTGADHRICKGCHKDLPLSNFTYSSRASWATFIEHCDECYQKAKNKRRFTIARTGLNARKHNRILVWAKRCINSHVIRGIKIEVGVDDLIGLLSPAGIGICHYTGDEIHVGYGASIDMKDPGGKFTLDNICLTSHACNSTKSAMLENEFKQYLLDQPKVMERLHKHNEEALKRFYASSIPLSELKRMAAPCQ